jgi:hypothetical protein
VVGSRLRSGMSALAGMLAGVAIAASTAAGDTLPMPVSTVTPANGAVVPQGTRLSFAVTTTVPCLMYSYSYTVRDASGNVVPAQTTYAGVPGAYT